MILAALTVGELKINPYAFDIIWDNLKMSVPLFIDKK